MKKAFIAGKGTRLDSIFYSLFKQTFDLTEAFEDSDTIELIKEEFTLVSVYLSLDSKYDQYFSSKLFALINILANYYPYHIYD